MRIIYFSMCIFLSLVLFQLPLYATASLSGDKALSKQCSANLNILLAQAPPGQPVAPGKPVAPGGRVAPGERVTPGERVPPGQKVIPGLPVQPGEKVTPGEMVVPVEMVTPGERVAPEELVDQTDENSWGSWFVYKVLGWGWIQTAGEWFQSAWEWIKEHPWHTLGIVVGIVVLVLVGWYFGVITAIIAAVTWAVKGLVAWLKATWLGKAIIGAIAWLKKTWLFKKIIHWYNIISGRITQLLSKIFGKKLIKFISYIAGIPKSILLYILNKLGLSQILGPLMKFFDSLKGLIKYLRNLMWGVGRFWRYLASGARSIGRRIRDAGQSLWSGAKSLFGRARDRYQRWRWGSDAT